jgi:hypothetical protein
VDPRLFYNGIYFCSDPPDEGLKKSLCPLTFESFDENFQTWIPIGFISSMDG